MTIDLIVRVDAGENESSTGVDRRCRELTLELHQVAGVSVGPVRIDGEPGTKAGLTEVIGLIAVSGASAATIKAVTNVLIAYINRSTASSITIRREDKEVIIEGSPTRSAEELAKQLLGDQE